MATVSQLSYPLNSENASPPGTCRVYLSCAEIALAAKTASTTAATPIVHILLRFITPRPLISQPLFIALGPAARGVCKTILPPIARPSPLGITELPLLVDHTPKAP